jgi:hypothetical protein
MIRKIFLLTAGIFCSIMLMASNADLFIYNTELVNNELSKLQVLENFIASNPEISLIDLELENSSLITGLNLNNSVEGSFCNQEEEPLGISPFLWGCCLGITGVAVVYFLMEDKEATKKAFKGCVIRSIVSTALTVVYYVIILAYGSSYSYYY